MSTLFPLKSRDTPGERAKLSDPIRDFVLNRANEEAIKITL